MAKKIQNKSKVSPGIIISLIILIAGIGGYLTYSSFAAAPLTTIPANYFSWYTDGRTDHNNYDVNLNKAGSLAVELRNPKDIGRPRTPERKSVTVFASKGMTLNTAGRWRICLSGIAYSYGSPNADKNSLRLSLTTQGGYANYSSNAKKESTTRFYEGRQPVNLCTISEYYKGEAVFVRVRVFQEGLVNKDYEYTSRFTLNSVTYQRY